MTASSHTPPAFLTARDGIEIAYSESGEGTCAFFVHATGFCKELCDPVIADTRDLGVEFRALAIDQRGHGDSATPLPPFDWWDIGRDVIDLIGGETSVIGIGHSAGGAALVLAELLRPGTFGSLILVEPIILPPPYRRYPDNPMSRGALRRKRSFTSRREAFENFMSKPAFAGWEERAMWAYVNGGMRPQNGSVALKCTPETEAEFFLAATTHGAWDRLDEIDVPTLLIAGESSKTHQEPFLAELTGRFPRARYEIVPDTSHFVWMERPGIVAAHTAEAIHRQQRVADE
jgi:pimeloyl-ACP methyl ester carboxylesterase